MIGWAGGVLRHEGDFHELVQGHEGKPLRLYVYSECLLLWNIKPKKQEQPLITFL